MIHLPHLITDLGFILVIAALSTLLFKKLGQPLVLGYLIAGFLVSPHVPFFPTVTDKASIQVWSEIGVIFLLFSLGLEFSFKKLFKVGGSAGFTAVFEVIFMVGLGYLVGRLLGWSWIDSLFFGGILSVSSTTIIVRAFQELGMRKQKYVELVFGILVVEDIVAIMLLVILAALAGTAAVSGPELAFSVLRLIFFIALWFVVGIFLIPIFLRKIRSLLEDETTLLVAIGLCFMMVIIAAKVGFSPALGAFVMGSLLAETPEVHKMEHLLKPVRDLFAAIFFVSVGMMIDPVVLMERWDLIILVTCVTIVGKLISTFLGAMLSGQSRKTSFQAGMSLAQIGEFSFIIASLGVSLKVTSDFLYPLAIAVSAVTTFTTPYLIKVAEPLFKKIDAKLPEGIRAAMDRYHSSFGGDGEQRIGSLIFKAYGVKILLNTVMVVAILGAFKGLVIEELKKVLQESPWTAAISLLLCLTMTAPFLWGVAIGAPNLGGSRAADELKKLRGLQLGLFIGRIILGLGLLGVILSQFVDLKLASGVVIGIVLFAAVFGQFWVRKAYKFFEKNFLKNLTEKERKELVSSETARKYLPWDASLGTYEICADSEFVGKPLRQVKLKERFGVTLAAIFRGSKRLLAPGGDTVIYPYDKVLCFGAEEDLMKFHYALEEEKNNSAEVASPAKNESDIKLSSYIVTETSRFLNKSIRDSGIRDHFRGGMVVGVERADERILGPTGDFHLHENDLLWIVSSPQGS
ncbi:cation:proton antiporter [Bdellovibrio bacteriovorus]|uniref:Cation:proton antiporter n=1 Tax=Bdellovibrio bacteriovorus TaxID=959 RepID=A0A150WJB3_BDEBC|nr:cation:proton antiporter [Bdellovibrio bacteriovorus]KYG63858.1 cation:proton antiporter [Bdellovibrio bacteriovorus]